MFITAAYAQTAPATGGGLSQFLQSPLPVMLVILVIMYFLILRPQQQRLKTHRDMVAALKRGDVVVTGGGLIGKVTKVINEAEIQVEVAEGVRVRVVRSTISEVRTRSDVREVEARKAASRKDGADNDDDEDANRLIAANDADAPKKDV